MFIFVYLISVAITDPAAKYWWGNPNGNGK